MPNLSNLDAWKSMKSSKNEVSTLTKNRTKQLFPLSIKNVEKPIHKVANRTILQHVCSALHNQEKQSQKEKFQNRGLSIKIRKG